MRIIFFHIMQMILKYKRNKIIKYALNDSMEFIADFGCGHYPNRHANILIDNLDTHDEQRGGLQVTQNQYKKKFYNINLNTFPYPFPDKYFDFLICSHVLEHLNDPVRTCHEFSRIAKAGYIEVPYYCADVFIENNNNIHNWLCAFNQEHRIIRFFPRKKWLTQIPPQKINIFMRFILQLNNQSVLWRDEVQAIYSDLS